MAGRIHHHKETWTETVGWWGVMVRARAVCEDGKLRIVRLGNPDSHFSCPARVSFRGKIVCGFISWKSEDGLSTNPVQWVAFTATGKHKDIFSRIALCKRLEVSEDIPDGILADLEQERS